MKRIGLLSDTHGFFDPKFLDLFAEVDELWHAGDVGSEAVLDVMEDFKPVRAVYGNIDDAQMRRRIPEFQRFVCEGVDVLMTHIGGYPGKYPARVKALIAESKPDIFLSGHSHILKVMPDKHFNLLHINPGAAGHHGFHAMRTVVRLNINNAKIGNLEVVELGRRGRD